jgi:hypothetical protein
MSAVAESAESDGGADLKLVSFMEGPIKERLEGTIGGFSVSDLALLDEEQDLLDCVPQGRDRTLAKIFIRKYRLDQYFRDYTPSSRAPPPPSPAGSAIEGSARVLDLRKQVIPARFASFAHEGQIPSSKLQSRFENLQHVEAVNLSSCGLTGADLQHLADWLGLASDQSRSSVHHINLSFNRISLLDQGENFLMILLQSVSGYVDVYGNPCASVESKEVFASWSKVDVKRKNFFMLIWISEGDVALEYWHRVVPWADAGVRDCIRKRHFDYYRTRPFPRYG